MLTERDGTSEEERRLVLRQICVSFAPLFQLLGFPGGSVRKESPCNAGDPGSIPGSGRSPGEGHGHPLQYSCLENPQRTEEPGGLQSTGLQRVRHVPDRLSTAADGS